MLVILYFFPVPLTPFLLLHFSIAPLNSIICVMIFSDSTVDETYSIRYLFFRLVMR